MRARTWLPAGCWFGPAVCAKSGNLDSDCGYAGLWHHGPSGLDLATYRLYDAKNRRWLSRDPLGEGVDLNLYRYCGTSPINLVDPIGLDPERREDDSPYGRIRLVNSGGFYDFDWEEDPTGGLYLRYREIQEWFSFEERRVKLDRKMGCKEKSRRLSEIRWVLTHMKTFVNFAYNRGQGELNIPAPVSFDFYLPKALSMALPTPVDTMLADGVRSLSSQSSRGTRDPRHPEHYVQHRFQMFDYSRYLRNDR